MERPTTRVLALLELLQTHGSLSGPVLARRIGVDIRTLRRYIGRLEELGVPIVSERGRHGGYRLIAGFKLPPMMFTSDEALALSVGLLAVRSLGLGGVAPAAASARDKLERVMPEGLRRQVRAIDETVVLDVTRYADNTGGHAVLIALSAAAQVRQRVCLQYRSAGGTASARDVDPYGLAWRGGFWYMAGYCHLRTGLRSFRLDRVESVQTMPVSFVRPDDFDALVFLAHAFATLPRKHAAKVLLKADLDTARRASFDAIGLFEPVADGVMLTAQVDDLDWFARELSRMPFDFEICSPPALCDAVAACAERLRRIAAPRSGYQP